ncbi:MAG: T9SS type A sorting domain-containing protein [Chitinophagaceae bacterium]|nr:T9SS type A sorting domain-containing protein [Chitinophagaceae bacterium]
MKKVLLPLLLLGSSAMAQSTYTGNGRTGFGGVIGPGSLQISDNGTNITLNLTRGTGAFNDILVIYFDSETGGQANTNALADLADGGRSAVSGGNAGSGSEVNFPTGFTADYALAWGNFGSALFRLTTGGNNSLTFVNFDASQTTRTIAKGDIGITAPTVSFSFIGTYASGTAFRSDEALVQDISGGNPGVATINWPAFNSYPSVPLNVTLKQFSARRLAGRGVELNWRAACTGAYARFELERSTDGRNFTAIHTEKADAARCNFPFQFADAAAGSGKLFYRLKLTSDAGRVTYSSIAIIMGSGGGNLLLSLQPTVVQGNALLQVNSGRKGNLNLRIVEAGGRVLSSQRISAEAGSQSVQLNTATLRPGIYNVVVTDDSNSTMQTVRMIKE